MNDLISVIVPVYNVEKYLERCIQSICNQTYKALEIILVNDGSTDSSGYICDQYAKADSRIKVIHKKNGGLSDARNYGIDLASGDYIAFVDSDDYVELQMYEYLLKALKENEADLAICNYQYCTETDNKLEVGSVYEYDTKKVELVAPYQAQELYFSDPKKRILYTVAWNKLYERKLFSRIRYPIGKVHEDEYTTFKLLYQAKKIVVLQDELYHYLIRKNSISGAFDQKRFDLFDAYLERLKFYRLHHKFKLWEKLMLIYMHMFAQYSEWAQGAYAVVLKYYIAQFEEECKEYEKIHKLGLQLGFEKRLFLHLNHSYCNMWKLSRYIRNYGT